MTSAEIRSFGAVNLRDECAFRWMLRDRATAAPNIRLLDLVRLDERLVAFCDSLAVAAEPIPPPTEPGEMFASVARALLRREPEEALAVLAAATERDAMRAAISPLAWFGAASNPVIAHLREAADDHLRAMAIASVGARRTDPGPLLAAALADASALVRARACRTAGQLGRVDLMPLLHGLLGDPECCFWSAWALARLGDGEPAIAALTAIAWQEGSHADAARELALRKLDVAQANAWLRDLARRPGRDRALIGATGVVGDPRYIPWLIEQMAEPVLARLAGEAFAMITGVDLTYRDLVRRAPEDFEAGPNDDPADETVALDEDEHLPWPDPRAVGEWWVANRERFTFGTAYFLGAPKKAAAWLAALSDGFQRQRRAAALELALRQPGKAMFEVRARGRLQRLMLARAQ